MIHPELASLTGKWERADYAVRYRACLTSVLIPKVRITACVQ
jgi:hypothetical protein